MQADGACPSCGRVLTAVARREVDALDAPFTPAAEEEIEAKVPWHFWLLVVAVVAYLGWRIVQMIGWLFD